MKKQIANIITSCRILLSITLLFCPVFSVCFYDIYLLCGFTDMVDGTIARKTNSASEFGARLDTTSDFLFFAVTLIKLMPVIHIPKWIWEWIVIIASLLSYFSSRRVLTLSSSTFSRKTNNSPNAKFNNSISVSCSTSFTVLISSVI